MRRFIKIDGLIYLFQKRLKQPNLLNLKNLASVAIIFNLRDDLTNNQQLILFSSFPIKEMFETISNILEPKTSK